MTTYYTKQGRRYVPAQPQPVPADPKPNYDDVGKGPWRDGPPPSAGWWPASDSGVKDMLRFHDGKDWSVCVDSRSSASDAGMIAEIKQTWGAIRWRDRADWWPERSRT